MVVRGLGRVIPGTVLIVSAALGVVGCAQHEQSAEQVSAPPAASGQQGNGPRVPEGYQVDDCPLPTGQLVSAIGSQGTYTLTYTVEDAAAFDSLLTKYRALGYEQVETEQPEMYRSATLSAGRWRVNLTYPEVAGFTLIVTAELIS